MFALICPNEPCKNGYRVAQLSNFDFEVAPPLYWAPCDPGQMPNCYYDPQTKTFVPLDAPAPDQPTTSGTQEL